MRNGGSVGSDLSELCEFEGHGWSEELPREPQSAAVARDFVSRAVGAWNMGSVDDAARLVVTELVTNAIVHVSEGRIRVSVSRKVGRRLLRIAVVDDSDTIPLMHTTGRNAPAGGLALVNQLTGGRWGTDLLARGKRVRADIPVGHWHGEW